MNPEEVQKWYFDALEKMLQSENPQDQRTALAELGKVFRSEDDKTIKEVIPELHTKTDDEMWAVYQLIKKREDELNEEKESLLYNQPLLSRIEYLHKRNVKKEDPYIKEILSNKARVGQVLSALCHLFNPWVGNVLDNSSDESYGVSYIPISERVTRIIDGNLRNAWEGYIFRNKEYTGEVMNITRHEKLYGVDDVSNKGFTDLLNLYDKYFNDQEKKQGERDE